MSKLYIGIDTSCYTTSVACIDSKSIVLDERTVLSVPSGERGLRQSDMLFQHDRNLPALLDRMFSSINPDDIAGVGWSKAPTADPDSYMPAFLAGILAGKAIAGARNVPKMEGTHQQGHFRAALYGNEKLMDRDSVLGFHISGGTTDLVTIRNGECGVENIERIGSGSDLHAGQMVDRIGVALGCGFPCGKELETLANKAVRRNIRIPSSVNGTDCSFSGAETNLLNRIRSGEQEEEIAYAVYDCFARTFSKMILRAVRETGIRDVLLAGGVSSSDLLRKLLNDRINGGAELYFGLPKLSSDNAVGIALMTEDRICRNS